MNSNMKVVIINMHYYISSRNALAFLEIQETALIYHAFRCIKAHIMIQCVRRHLFLEQTLVWLIHIHMRHDSVWFNFLRLQLAYMTRIGSTWSILFSQNDLQFFYSCVTNKFVNPLIGRYRSPEGSTKSKIVRENRGKRW